jgi:L-threonylcarbamoyladenylate synthase
LIAADFAQIEPFLAIPSPVMREKLVASWPGPVTWIVPASQAVPKWLCGKRGTLAVRVTDHPLCAALCREFGGAIISTSANPSGAKPARSLLKTRRYFTRAPLCYLPGKLGGLERPTAIFDARDGRRLR